MDFLKNNQLKSLLTLLNGYFVGGCVRDFILGKKPKDIDIVCPHSSFKIEELLQENNYNYRPHSKAFRIYVVQLDNNCLVEISPMRMDYNYSPTNIIQNLEFDCSYRDLTINAMAMDANGKILDFFGGWDDLNQKVIRFVKNPLDRILEDNIRPWRALRFSYQLNFNLDYNTIQGIETYINFFFKEPLFKALHIQKSSLNFPLENPEQVHGLYRLSVERIADEIEKILLNISFDRTKFLLFSGLLQTSGLPILETLGLGQPKHHHDYDVFTHTLNVVNYTPPILELRLATLCHDLGKLHSLKFKPNGHPTFHDHEEISKDICYNWTKKLKFSKNIIKTSSLLVQLHMKHAGQTNKSKIKFFKKFSNKNVFNLFFYHRLADILGKGLDRDDSKMLQEHVHQCLTILKIIN